MNDEQVITVFFKQFNMEVSHTATDQTHDYDRLKAEIAFLRTQIIAIEQVANMHSKLIDRVMLVKSNLSKIL